MFENMGLVDRMIRALFAIIVILAYHQKWITGTVAVVLGVIAVIFFATSFFGYCPLYHLLGISSKKK